MTADALPANPVVVTGYFDVLTGDLVRELERIRAECGDSSLAAVVLPSPDALLGLRARAELAAALAVIDYVLISEIEDSTALLEALSPHRTIRLEAADRAWNRRLREHVRSRHSR